jgi:hypothetical protein
MLFAPSLGRADALSGYSVQVLAQLGHVNGNFTPHNVFGLSQLNDRGQMVVATTDSQGNQILGQYTAGQFTPIAAAGGAAPGGKTWPKGMGFVFPISMNDAGNIAFIPVDSNGAPLGVYLWNAGKRSVIPVAEPGVPAVNGLVFAQGGDTAGAWINNHDEVAFVAFVKSASSAGQTGLFRRAVDGQIQAVALPGDPLPGLAKSVKDPGDVSINDAGLIAFDDVGSGNVQRSGFLWDTGTITSTAAAGTQVSGFGTLLNSYTDGVNNKNRNVWIVAATQQNQNAYGMFLARDGQLLPVVLPGQEMPGGGTFVGDILDWCPPNELGQYPFVTHIKGNGATTTAAYMVQPDATLSLIAKSGMTTELGTITEISPWLGDNPNGSFGIGLNSQGQVALTAQIDRGPDTLLLLTPKTP